jgi:predicted ATPase
MSVSYPFGSEITERHKKHFGLSIYMYKKIAIDGAAGAGKTTLLFGRGTEDPPDTRYDCLADRGYIVMPESGSIVARSMASEGKDLAEHFEELFQRVIEEELKRETPVKENADGIVFLDRGLPGYIFGETVLNMKFPQEFYDACRDLRYDSPIILLEPLKDFDISGFRPGQIKERTFTLEQRQAQHIQVRNFYLGLGYQVKEIPDIQCTGKTTKRIEEVLRVVL